MAETLPGAPDANYRQIEARVAPPIDPSSEVDTTCFMTTDSIDRDNEVVLPAGGDLSQFEKNPILLLNHDWQRPVSYHPLPVGKVMWMKKRPHGILAGIKFSRTSPMGQEVKGLFDEQMLKSFSIGFRSIKGSGMTRSEAETRPDWLEAYERTRGRIHVHREWQLLELSVAPVPCNPDALVASYKSRGVPLPSWLEVTMSNDSDTTSKAIKIPFDIGQHVKCLKGCGEVKGAHVYEGEQHVDVDMHDSDHHPVGVMKSHRISELKPFEELDGNEGEIKATRPVRTGADREEREVDDGDLPEDGETASIKCGTHVKCGASHYKGFGVVKSVHKDGMVPDVEEDMRATRDDPACRVKCYKAMGDGYVATDHHVAVKCSDCKALDEPMQPPSKKRGKAVTPAVELPELVALDDRAILEREVSKLNVLLSPAGLQEMVAKELDKRMGVV